MKFVATNLPLLTWPPLCLSLRFCHSDTRYSLGCSHPLQNFHSLSMALEARIWLYRLSSNAPIYRSSLKFHVLWQLQGIEYKRNQLFKRNFLSASINSELSSIENVYTKKCIEGNQIMSLLTSSFLLLQGCYCGKAPRLRCIRASSVSRDACAHHQWDQWTLSSYWPLAVCAVYLQSLCEMSNIYLSCLASYYYIELWFSSLPFSISNSNFSRSTPIGFCTVVSDLIDCHQTWFTAKADAIFVPTEASARIFFSRFTPISSHAEMQAYKIPSIHVTFCVHKYSWIGFLL